MGQAKRTPCRLVRQALPEKVIVEKRLKQVREEEEHMRIQILTGRG